MKVGQIWRHKDGSRWRVIGFSQTDDRVFLRNLNLSGWTTSERFNAVTGELIGAWLNSSWTLTEDNTVSDPKEEEKKIDTYEISRNLLVMVHSQELETDADVLKQVQSVKAKLDELVVDVAQRVLIRTGVQNLVLILSSSVIGFWLGWLVGKF